jgi:hypothetical protein
VKKGEWKIRKEENEVSRLVELERVKICYIILINREVSDIIIISKTSNTNFRSSKNDKNPPPKLIQGEVNWQMYHYCANQKLVLSDNSRASGFPQFDSSNSSD